MDTHARSEAIGGKGGCLCSTKTSTCLEYCNTRVPPPRVTATPGTRVPGYPGTHRQSEVIPLRTWIQSLVCIASVRLLGHCNSIRLSDVGTAEKKAPCAVIGTLALETLSALSPNFFRQAWYPCVT
eukprot:2922385-Rhodomonas_salina.1